MFCEIAACVVCCLLLTGAQELSIAPPGTQIKNFESGMIFTCTLSGHRYTEATRSPVLRWIGPNRRYINETKGRVYIERQDQFILRLYITEIQEKDAGLYSCEADVSGSTMVEEARMFLYEDIKFQETPTFVEGVIGSDQLLECRASGQPEPEISWRFNNHRITLDTAKYVEEKNGLVVNSLDLRDAGNYECRAEVSSHGNLKVRAITVDVLYPPVMLRELPATVNAVRGSPVELNCEGVGNPPVTYEWFQETWSSRETPVKTRLSISENKLKISAAGEDDEGKYFCRISNSLGTKKTSTSLYLIVPPQVHGLPSLRTAVEGQTVELKCEASGFPTPKISWTRGRQQLDSPLKGHDHHHHQDLGRISVEAAPSGVSRLVIHEIQRNETENYTCTAKNEGGMDSKSMSLSVEYLPAVKVEGPKVEMGWPGRVVTFTCTAQGLPVPKVTWIHNSHNVIDTDAITVRTTRQQVVASTLQVKIGGDRASGYLYGHYMCIAKNSHGHDIGNMTLLEADTPDPPGNVSVVEERSTWVRLSADRPRRDGGMAVTRWKVVHEMVSPGAAPVETTVFKDNDNLTVAGLRPGSTYTFYLHAGNAVGYGKPVKFLVRTPKRMQFKEQSDVAEHSSKGGGGGGGGGREDLPGYPEGKIPALIVDMVAEEEMEWGGKEGNTARGGGGGGGLPGFVLATAVGCAVVMATVVLAVVCFSWRRRRRQVARRSYGVKDPKEMAFADRLPVHNRALPASRKNSHNCACASPLPVRPPQPTTPLQPASSSTYSLLPFGAKSTTGVEGGDGGGGGSLQRRAWDSMAVERKGLGTRLEASLQGHDLSPSPKFLLDAARCYEAGEVPRERRTPVTPVAAGAYGYRSADCVDDDIDEIDFTIRIPSYRGQIQPYL